MGTENQHPEFGQVADCCGHRAMCAGILKIEGGNAAILENLDSRLGCPDIHVGIKIPFNLPVRSVEALPDFLEGNRITDISCRKVESYRN